jgi:glycosyltransferase involved in cell wall biosynthesis
VIVSQKERVKLIVVGSGNQEPYRQLASSLNINSKVVFVGSVDSRTLRELYSACDLFVSPSYLEGFGITLLEAMASGKPVVAMKVGGIPEVIKDGIHGKLVSHTDSNELAQAILDLARDQTLAKTIGRENSIFAKNYSWHANAKLTEQVYKNLLDSF